MKRSLLTTLVLCVVLAGTAHGDVVIDWNNKLLEGIRTGFVAAPDPPAPTNPPVASRQLAMVHTAIYDAVNSIDNKYAPYLNSFNVPATTSREAAAAQAARDVLVSLYPIGTANIDSLLNTHLSAIPDGADKLAGINLGSQAAAAILSARATDHATDPAPYAPAGTPGRWEPTPPGFVANPLVPGWGNVTPWSMTSGSQFRPAAPPALTSAEYAAAVNEVQEIGSATSATRTADQTAIARFWADGSGTSTPPGHWNQIAQTVATDQGNSISDNARLFALLNIAQADAAIACWDAKYAYDLWRPVTAIREADSDGNAATIQDDSWTSLIITPPFPTYTSGHSTFSGAAATILARFFETDNITFTTSAEGFLVADRTFTSFSAAADEAALSRLYGGIHFSFDNEMGLLAGIAIGNQVYNSVATPEPSTFLLGGLGLAGLGSFVLRRKLRRG